MTRLTAFAVSLLVVGAAAGCGSSKSKKSGSGSTSAAASSGSTTGSTTGSTGGSASLAPIATDVAPHSGPVDGGTRVTITGSGFLAAGAGETLVLFGTAGARATAISDTQLEVTAPLSLSAGVQDVRVVNELGTARLQGAWTYDPRPAGLTASPSVGHFEIGLGGTEITLETTVMPVTSLTTVTVGGVAVPAGDVTQTGPNTLVILLPDVPPGSVDILVDDQGQTVTATGFKVQGALSYGDLIVNEFCPWPAGIDANQDGVGDSKADEFVEIVNTTAEPIDLTYLTLYDARSERHRFPNPTTLPPGGAIAVFGGGTSTRFDAQHRSGSAQQATTSELALNNTADSIEIRTLPGLNPSGIGDTIFKVDYDTPPSAASYVNRADGQVILSNPATTSDYEDHQTAPGANGVGFTPARKVDGSRF